MKISIGARLKEERERLGLSQAAMGDIGGVKKWTQIKYEKGDSSPDSVYLALLSKFGLDIQYVVVGEHSMSSLDHDESELLSLYRSAPLVVKAAALAALTAGSSTVSIKVSGNGNRVAGRDYNEDKE